MMLHELLQRLTDLKAEFGGDLIVYMRDVGRQPFRDHLITDVDFCEEESQRGEDGRPVLMKARIVLM